MRQHRQDAEQQHNPQRQAAAVDCYLSLVRQTAIGRCDLVAAGVAVTNTSVLGLFHTVIGVLYRNLSFDCDIQVDVFAELTTVRAHPASAFSQQ